MRITLKQRQVLEVVCQGLTDEKNRRIGWLDTQQICDRVPYEVSLHSMKFTIRFLGEKGMVEKGEPVLRRNRWVVPIKATNQAYDYVVSRANMREIENDDGVVELFL